MDHRPIRVAVTGAGGAVSYSLIFRIAAGGMFGWEQPVALRLLETPKSLSILQANAMELHDGAFPLLAQLVVSTDPYEAFADVDWAILIGGFPLKQYPNRYELIRANGPIFTEQGRALNQVAPRARVLVVATPCNTNCLIARTHAPNLPSERWFALTRLDQNRAMAMLAEKAGVSVAQVTRMTVWGNHSESVFPDFHNAWIGDRPAPEVITDREWVRNVFEPGVGRRSREVHEQRGASPAGSASQAILATVRALTTPTPLERRFSVGVVSDGSYGVPRGLVFGFPVRTEDGVTYSIVKDLFLDLHSQERIAANVAELEHEAAVVTDLLGTVP